MRAFALASALGAATALAGAAPSTGSHEVVIEGMRFAPAEITVARGDSVVWRNKDLVPHTATSPGAFDSGDIPAGGSWRYTASKSGRYDYVCNYHPGMKATLVVR